MDDLHDSYRVLEVVPGASPDELKRAYRDLVKVWHPDRFADDPRLQGRAQEKLKQINLAYGIVTEPRVVRLAKPPAPPAAPFRPEPSSWSAGAGVRPPGGAADAAATEAAAELTPPVRKRNWEPTLVRGAILVFIAFQLGTLAVIVSVIRAAFAVRP
ncbi:MAG: J domain-containing protein [Verrucomicrobiota bacterium]